MAKIAALHAKKDDGLTAKVRDLYRPLESSIQTMTRDHRSIVNHLNAASRQATPLQVDGRTMLVFCGLQTTKASIEEGKGFFDGSTLSAQFSRTIIEILATSESPGFGSCFGSVRPILCFNNLYQWVGNEIQSGNVSNDVFYQWLSLIKPLIIVTLGKEVAKVINKKSGYTPIENLVRAAGRARVVNRDKQEEAILIPLLHPGFDRRSQQSSLQRRMFFVPNIAVWVYLDSTLKTLQEERSRPWSRQEFCQSINTIAQRKLQQSGFYDALNSVSEQFLVEQAKAHPISHRINSEPAHDVRSPILRPFHSNTVASDKAECCFSDCKIPTKSVHKLMLGLNIHI
ncbi:unnamed protein product [Alternaria alternata]